MKTIPTSWKPSADRNTWYNNRGKPIIFVRIEKVDSTYVRMSNRHIQFAEEGGVNRWYDNKYYKSLSTIDFALNMMQGWAGAIGQMGEAKITINNGEINSTKFTDLYNLDDLINGKVDIWFVPEECEDISIGGALQIYKGVITNYSMTCLTIKLVLNDYSNIKHKNIPQRIDEFNSDQSLGWTIPRASQGKIIPICFGAGYFKAYLVNTVEGTPRYYYIGYHYKDTRSASNILLYSYNQTTKNFDFERSTNWSEHSYLSGDLYLIRFNAEDLTFYAELIEYITPYDADSPSGRWHDEIKIYDQESATHSDGSYLGYDDLSPDDTWYYVGYIRFKKSEFNAKGNFDLYFCLDGSYSAAVDNERFVVKFKQGDLNQIVELTNAEWVASGGSKEFPGIPAAYLDHGMTPIAARIKLFKKNVNIDDLWTKPMLYVYVKRTANCTYVDNIYLWELCLKQVMLALPRDMYVKDDFGNNIISDAISYVFTNFLNIPSADVVFENFESDYKIDGQLYEEQDSYDFFSQLANEFGIIFFEDEEGKERFIDITGTDSVYDISENDINMDNKGQLALELRRTSEDIFSAFFVDYQKNYATNEYEASKYVTKDNNNLLHIDANDMMRLCYSAYQDYNTEKRLSVKLDYVRDDETAERILGKLVQFYNKKRIVVKYQSSLKLIDHELGDQVTFNVTGIITSTINWYVIGKTINYESKTIDWVLLESPWTGAGLYKTGSEGVDISDAAHIHIGQSAAEDVRITDSAVAFLEVP